MVPGRKSLYTIADASESGKYKMFVGVWSSGELEPGGQNDEAASVGGVTSVNAEDGDLDI